MNEIEFLKARLDELEREFEGHDFDYTAHDSGTSFCRHTSHVSGWSSTCPKATHSTLIRAQIAAQRKAIDLHEPELQREISKPAVTRVAPDVMGAWIMKKDIIRALIQPFSNHADFDPTWLDGFERQYLNNWTEIGYADDSGMGRS